MLATGYEQLLYKNTEPVTFMRSLFVKQLYFRLRTRCGEGCSSGGTAQCTDDGFVRGSGILAPAPPVDNVQSRGIDFFPFLPLVTNRILIKNKINNTDL